MPAIVVLVKNVPDTWSTKSLTADFTLDREAADNVIDEINEFAVEQALRLREANPEFTVVALSAGPAGSEEALRKAPGWGPLLPNHPLPGEPYHWHTRATQGN